MRKHDIESSPISATETSELPYNPDFKGCWIPREIFLRRDINASEKMLWSTIYNLHCRKHGGCYASEEYLCEYMGMKRRQIYEMLRHLKALGLIEDVAFDGRVKVRKAVYTQEVENKAPPQECGKAHPSSAEKRTAPIIYDNKAYIKDKGESSAESTAPASISVSKKLINRALHVETTEEEHGKLVKLRGESFVQHCYTTLSIWKVRTPRSKWKKGDYLSILKWVINAVDDEAKKGKSTVVDSSGDNKSPEEKNKEFAQKAADHCNPGIGKKKGVTIEIFSNYVIVKRLGSKSWEPINFRDANFNKRFTHELMKFEMMERKVENE